MPNPSTPITPDLLAQRAAEWPEGEARRWLNNGRMGLPFDTDRPISAEWGNLPLESG